MQRVAPEIDSDLASVPEGLNGEAVAYENRATQSQG